MCGCFSLAVAIIQIKYIDSVSRRFIKSYDHTCSDTLALTCYVIDNVHVNNIFSFYRLDHASLTLLGLYLFKESV